MILVIGFLVGELLTNLKTVNALEMYNSTFQTTNISGYDRNINGFYLTNAFSLNQNQTFNFAITGKQIYDYDYFIGHLYWHYYDNLDLTTNNYTFEYDNHNKDYYCSQYGYQDIQYADGTYSRINTCENWTLDIEDSSIATENTAGSIRGDIHNKLGIQVDLLMDNNYWSVCEVEAQVDGATTFKCPLNTNYTNITRIRIRYTALDEVTTGGAVIGIGNVYNLYKDPVSSLITQQEEANSKIEEIQNQDIPTESKEAPNQDAFNNYENKENQIKQATSNANMNAVNVAMDIPTSNWIWDTLTRILNTNPMIMSMMITFLSIGVIKLILRR